MYSSAFIVTIALCITCTMASDAANEPLAAVSKGAAVFGMNFFKSVAKQNTGENLISSPLSAYTVLSMAAYGAGGNTAKEMRQGLALPANDAVAYKGFENLIDQLNNVEKVTLEIANKMYLANNLRLNPEYKQLTSSSFRSEASEIDISNPEESLQIVNRWVDEKTHHKIDSILSKGDINDDTRMILLNALYFKGKWQHQFSKNATQDRVFHLDEKTQKNVPTMYVKGDFLYGELPDLKAKFIELPYENKDLKMVIIVPDEINGLAQIVENLEAFNSKRLYESAYKQEVELYLPKFKIESKIDLKQPLEELGMVDMFSNAANFSGISEENLKVGKVLQKAFIEVNEEGSEAAAVTESKVVLYLLPVTFNLTVDHPFYYEIVKQSKDNGERMVLFAGLIDKP